MDEHQIEAALGALGEELGRRDVKAKLWVVGGAMIILSYHSRELTRDVDAAMNPREDVLAAAHEVASHLGLPGDWLNDSAAAYIPPTGSEQWLPVRNYGPALEVLLADPRMVLAMKLRAAREPRDRPDIEVLVRECDVRSVEEGLALYGEFFPEDPIGQMGRVMLQESIEAAWGAPTGHFDFEEIATGGSPVGAPLTAGVRAGVAPDRPRSPNEQLWAWSVRGRVAHRISRATGDDLLTACGHRLALREVKMSKQPRKPPCRSCDVRRPVVPSLEPDIFRHAIPTAPDPAGSV